MKIWSGLALTVVSAFILSNVMAQNNQKMNIIDANGNLKVVTPPETKTSKAQTPPGATGPMTQPQNKVMAPNMQDMQRAPTTQAMPAAQPEVPPTQPMQINTPSVAPTQPIDPVPTTTNTNPDANIKVDTNATDATTGPNP